jgi:hypothetical protein
MKILLGRHKCSCEAVIDCYFNCSSCLIFRLLNSPKVTTLLQEVSPSMSIKICLLLRSEVDGRLNVLLKPAAFTDLTNISITNRNYANVMLGTGCSLRYISYNRSFGCWFYCHLCVIVYLSIYLSIYRSIYLSIHPSIHPSNHRFISLSIYLSVCLSKPTYLPIYGSTAFVHLGRFFSFIILTQSVGLLDGGSGRLKASAYTQNKRTQTSMPRVGFQPTIPVFELAKTIHALDSAATVIGGCDYT